MRLLVARLPDLVRCKHSVSVMTEHCLHLRVLLTLNGVNGLYTLSKLPDVDTGQVSKEVASLKCFIWTGSAWASQW